MTDAVIAHDIEVMTRIGCSEEERAFPQRLLVSVRAETDTRPVARSLNLDDSICYATICRMAVELGSARAWVLCEEFADRFATEILERFPAASGVRVSIKKFIVPGVQWTGVEVERARS